MADENKTNKETGTFSFEKEGNVVYIFINFGSATNNASGSGDPSTKARGTSETQTIDNVKPEQSPKGNTIRGANT